MARCPHGGTPRLLTSAPGCYSVLPVWSPDGHRVAFLTFPYSAAGLFHDVKALAVVSADGSGRVVLTGYDNTAEPPAWSPDGSYIAVARDGAQGSQGLGPSVIELIPAAGGPARDVTSGPADTDPVFVRSP
jgi:hypothetical protein